MILTFEVEARWILRSSLYIGAKINLISRIRNDLQESTKERILTGGSDLEEYGRIFMECEQESDFDAAVNKRLDNLNLKV